jgi:hypothetical protein
VGNLLNGIQTATLTKNTWALCATRHTVKAEATGAEAGKDNILVSYKLESTSGIGKGYHTKDGFLHKIRITIFKDGEIAYQQDVAGDDSGNFITLPPFLITGEGKWEITTKTIAAGDCAKPEGEKNFAYLYAKTPEPVEEEQEEDRAKTAQDLTPLLTVGVVGLAGLVFGKVLRGKRKEAETFEAQAPKKFNCEQIIYDAFYGNGDEKLKKFQEGITKSTPFFNLSFIPPLKGYNESETKQFKSEMNHFLRQTKMYHLANSATFGALRINGKEFAWVKFTDTDDYAIATKSSIFEQAKSDLLSEQALKDGTAIGVKGNENLRKMLARLLDKEEYEKFRTTIVRYGIKHKNYVVASALYSLEIAFRPYQNRKSDLERKAINQLKAILKARGLSTSGTRQNYIDRIEEDGNSYQTDLNAETFEAPMKGAQPPRKGNTADGLYLTGEHTKAIRKALKKRFPDLKIKIKKGGSSVIIHEGHSIMKQDPLRKDIEKTIHEAIKDVERKDWGWTPEQGSEWVAVSIHGFPTGGNAYQTDFDAETFEAPKKQPKYKKVMEVLKQGLYEPNSEQYKLMREIDPDDRRLENFWAAYAYLEWKGASEEGYSHPEYGKNFVPMPTNIKDADKAKAIRRMRRQEKKSMPLWIMNRDDFIKTLRRARKTYGVNYEQEGFPAIFSHWMRYDRKLFYYETPAVLDELAIITATQFYSIIDDKGREAFNNMDNKQKRGLLKGDKNIYYGK